jgi:hypothetical protein
MHLKVQITYVVIIIVQQILCKQGGCIIYCHRWCYLSLETVPFKDIVMFML